MSKLSKLIITLLMFFSVQTAFCERIVSLSPGLTEILFAIGAGDDVVGVTQFCDYPPDALKIDKVGSGFRPSAEKIASLKPTLVFGSVEGGEKSLKRQLDGLGIENYFFRSKDADDIIHSIKQISLLLDINSETLVEELQSHFNSETKTDKSGLFLVGVDPFSAAGASTFVNDIMNCAGVRNIAADSFDGYVLVSYEYILSENPDYIFVSAKMGSANLENFIERLKSSGVRSEIVKLDCDCYLRPSQRIKQACIQMRDTVR